LAAKEAQATLPAMIDNPDDKNAFGVWPGEVTTDLPASYDASLYYIGRIRTPWKERKDCPKNARESEAVCTLELDPRWAAGLKDVETCSHLVVLYWMDRSRRDIVLQVPRHYCVQRGTFALRSPARPNPIALSVVKLVRVVGNKVEVVGLDCSTTRRSSTSSRISLRLMPSPTRRSAGMRRGIPRRRHDADTTGATPVAPLMRSAGTKRPGTVF
jgi:tRNA-Thr(GGU) m(6)t(6)A37 methyltransferase TsaA